MADEEKKLTKDNPDDTMQKKTGSAGAGEGTPEDTPAGTAYEQTITKQQDTINTLLERIDSLNAQIADYVRSTGSKADEGANPDDNGQGANANAIPEDYVYLKDLGKEIGKRERR